MYKATAVNIAYQHIVDYLFQKLPMFQRIGPAAFKKDLTNIIKLLDYLGNPHEKFPSVHIAGTNGKGSTAHMLAAVLQAEGHKVGLHTSPHYKDFRERLKVNGNLPPKQYVIDFVEQHRPFIELLQPSFFEVSVAMSFHYFALQQVDIAIVETGLGGRLDSTNILKPLVSVITNISFDHQQFLGDTLEAIAGEKAGIVKEKTPVVVGESQPQTQGVFLEKARLLGAAIDFADQHYVATMVEDRLAGVVMDVCKNGQPFLSNLVVEAGGRYQEKNVVTVLQTLDTLGRCSRFSTSENSIRRGLSNILDYTRFIGRWMVKQHAPLLILDSAHNTGGMEPVMQQLAGIPRRNLHLVIGMVNDKEPDPVLKMLPTSAQYYFAKADIPRGMPAANLAALAAPYHLKGKAYSSVQNALRAAKRRATPEDLIFVTGSIFVVAEVI